MKKYLGIDFGTTNSTVAIYDLDTGCLVLDENKRAVPIDEEVQARAIQGIPTLYCKYGEQEFFGLDCRKGYDICKEMKKTIRNDFKSLTDHISVGTSSYSVKNMIKGFLNYLIKLAQEKLEFDWNDIAGVTVTAPICQGEESSATVYKNFLKSEVEKIIQEHNSRFSKDDVYVLEEPVAAAISYLYNDKNKIKVDGKGHIMVFDLGGGTLDVSIVGYDSCSNSCKIVAKAGDNLGGSDWDLYLQEHILEKIKYDQVISSENQFNFEEKAKTCKHALSYDNAHTFLWTVNGDRIRATIDRKDFEQVTEGLREKAKDVIKEAKGKFGGNIDKIVLVGGGSNMPQIKNQVFYAENSMGKVIQHNPSMAIAIGAAKYAQIRWNKLHGNPLSSSTTGITDIATHTYGFCAATSENDDKKMIYCMIHEGTAFNAEGKIIAQTSPNWHAHKEDYDKFFVSLYEVNKNVEKSDWAELTDGKELELSVEIPVPTEYKDRVKNYNVSIEFVLDQNNILRINVYHNNKRVGEGKYKI